MKIMIGLSFLSIAIIPLKAKDFAKSGHVFPIIEESLIAVIQRQLQKTPLPFLKSKTPKATDLLKETASPRTFYYDPTYTAKETISDSNGNIVIKKGASINPLKDVQLTSGLLLLDGTKASHIQWAHKQKGCFKWILVKGDPFAIERQQKRSIYFDQCGFTTQKLHIEHVPARVTQEGYLLKIEEISITSTGEEK